MSSANKTYEVSLDAPEGGNIAASRSGTVYEGTKIEFFFEPEEGYELVSASVNGEAVEVVAGRYVLPSLTRDVSVTAVFRRQAQSETGDVGCGSAFAAGLPTVLFVGAAIAVKRRKEKPER